MKNFFLISFVCVSFSFLHAQNPTGISPSVKQNDDAQLLYRNEQEFGAVLHSAGWGLNYRRGKHVTGYKKRTLELEFATLKNPKEIKSEVQDLGTKGYYYGKQFSVFLLRGGYGYHKIITGKSDRRGVELRLVTIGGPVIAFAKPVYLEIFRADQNPLSGNLGNVTIERYDPNNPAHVPVYPGSSQGIVGRASYFKAFGEMNFFPVAFFKLGLGFEHSNQVDDIKLLKTLKVVKPFYKTIPILAYAHNNQVYVNLYLNIMFGKKWF